jgi:hypothetical protein
MRRALREYLFESGRGPGREKHQAAGKEARDENVSRRTGVALLAARCRRPALLATRFTMEQPFYAERLRARYGLDPLVPDRAGRDVVHGIISVDSIMENIGFLIGAAEAAGLKAILSTIPPRKDELGSNPVVHQKMIDLNARLAEFADDRMIGFIDTFGTFMAHDFPDGWKALMEDVGGNHPSPAGHVLIADLFAGRLVLFPPRVPAGLEKILTESPSHWRVQWQAGLESDLACYRLEYGATETTMSNVAVLDENFMVFPGFPSRPNFFRVQAVDNMGYRSEFTGIRSTAERGREHRGTSPHKGETVRGR